MISPGIEVKFRLKLQVKFGDDPLPNFITMAKITWFSVVYTQQTFTCSNSTTKTPAKGEKFV